VSRIVHGDEVKGWGAQDDFQEQIQATVDERVELVRLELVGNGCEFCEDCGRRIPKARRKAMPSATRCVSCQEYYE
jgi:phage/conjugal plasmid C-4 type zinc finger TraR family protein